VLSTDAPPAPRHDTGAMGTSAQSHTDHRAGEQIDGVLLGSWLEPSDVVDHVEAVETAVVGRRCRLGYRLRGVNPDGPFAVEQQGFFEVADGKITWLRMLCSGCRPDTDG
jgi:hypothetical protein